MKIFNSIPLATGGTEIQQHQINLATDDVQTLIQRLLQAPNPHETILMAEHPTENQFVLENAVRHWFGYGLYYPDLDQLDQNQLHADFPKIILLNPNDPMIETFTNMGHVVFDFDEYQYQIAQLLSWVPPLGDGD